MRRHAEAAFFRGHCARCGEQTPPHSQHWVAVWNSQHEAAHRALDDAANAPLINLGA